MRKVLIYVGMTLLLLQGVTWSGLPLLCEGNSADVEILVRAIHKEETVKDLSRDDFSIFENGILQEVQDFRAKQKRISGRTADTGARTIVLVFQITDFNDQIERSLDLIFDRILLGNDRLIVLANDRWLHCTGLDNKDKAKQDIKKILVEKSIEKRKKTIAAVNYFQKKTRLIYQDTHEGILREYLRLWHEYKTKHLLPDFNWMQHLPRFLANGETENWLLHFYQLELYPMLGLTRRYWNQVRDWTSRNTDGGLYAAFGRTLQRLIHRVETEINLDKELPLEKIIPLFYRVNATCHSFLMKARKGTIATDLNYKWLCGSIEKNLTQLTRASGGMFAASKNTLQSLESILAKEDYYYLLTYRSNNPDSAAETVVVKTANKKYRLFYASNR